MLGQRFNNLKIKLVFFVPTAHSAASQRERRVGDHSLRVEKLNDAQPIAFRAGAHRIVEGKEPRLQLLQGIRTNRAGELGGEHVRFATVHFQRNGSAFGVAQRRFE
jgi:hypothetical protein